MNEKANTMQRQSSKRTPIIVALTLVIALLVSTVTYAWFKNTVEVDGLKGNTGKFLYEFGGFDANNNQEFYRSTNDPELQDQNVSITGPDEVADPSQKQGFLVFNGAQNEGAFYFLVHKLPGSIDLDVSLRLNADVEKLKDADGSPDSGSNVDLISEENQVTEGIIGGFWYKIETKSFASNNDFSTEKGNVSTQFSSSETNRETYFPQIRKEVRRASLMQDNYWCVKVSFGRNHNANSWAYTDHDVNIYATLSVAQKGGLDEDGTNLTHYASTEQELKDAILKYYPGDTIQIEGDIDFYGDLIFNRPVTLTINSGSLNVYGDMRYTYVSKGNFYLYTTGGPLTVNKMTDANAGGNLYVELPNATLEVYGVSTDEGLADIQIEESVYASASYVSTPDGDNPMQDYNDLGLYLSSVRITDKTGAPKDIYLNQQTKITIGQHTSVGKISVIRNNDAALNAIRVYILNYGTIDGIDLSLMNQYANYENPRIFIHNFGIINKISDYDGEPAHIKLPNWSAKYVREYVESSDGTVTIKESGNTRIISEDGSSKIHIDRSLNCAFTDNDIETLTRDLLVEKVNGSSTDIIVHYLEKDYVANNGNTTIGSIIAYYSTLNTDDRISDPSTLTSIKIVCYPGAQKQLTQEDYDYIRTLGSLVSLDLGSAWSDNNTLPDNAFAGMGSLTNITLSERDVIWGSNLFSGTNITTLVLPRNMQSMQDNSLSDGASALGKIQYLYVRNNHSVLAQCVSLINELAAFNATDQSKRPPYYLICGSDTTRDALIQLVEQAADIPSIKEPASGEPMAEQLAKISTILVGDNAKVMGNYLVTLYEASKSCTIHAYLGDNFIAQDERNGEFRFDLSTFYANGVEYKVTAFDDFAFFLTHKEANGYLSNATDQNREELIFHTNLLSIGDAAFYGAGLPKNVNLGGCQTVGHVAFAKNERVQNLIGNSVQTLGYYSCAFESTTVNFIKLPASKWCYGNVFGNTASSEPLRLDIGVIQPMSGVSKTTGYDTLYGPNVTGKLKTTVVVYGDLPSGATQVTHLLSAAGAMPERLIAPNAYIQNSSNVNAILTFDIGSATADTIKFVNWNGNEIDRNSFETGQLAFLPVTGGYKLLTHVIDETIDANVVGEPAGILRIPSYNDSAIEIGRHAFHYMSFINVDTLTFADSYTTLDAYAFSDRLASGDNTKIAAAKYFAKLDLNQITTLGEGCFKWWGASTLISVEGSEVSRVGKQAFHNNKALRIVSLPLLAGDCTEAFASCTNLEMALVGGITGERVFKDADEKFLLFVNAEGVTTNGYVTLVGTRVQPLFTVISLGGDVNKGFYWGKEQPNGVVVSPKTLIEIFNVTYKDLVFADYSETSVAVKMNPSANSERIYTIYKPTYMFTESNNELNLRTAFDLQNINEDAYQVPEYLYTNPGEGKITSVLGQVDRYYTENEDSYVNSNMHVVEIGSNAYKNKITVNSITFPEGLRKIGEGAFADCEFGGAVNIKGHDDGLVIDAEAFKNCKMASLIIDNVTSIGDSAFKGIKSQVDATTEAALSEIKLGSKLSEIGQYAFQSAKVNSIVTTHVLGNENTDPIKLIIKENAFNGITCDQNTSLSVNFAAAVVDFGAYSFSNVNLNNISAQYTFAVRSNAFQHSNITGTVDFSVGIPAMYRTESENQIIEVNAFSGSTNQEGRISGNLGTVKLGYKVLLKGEQDDTGAYIGAFTDCAIQSLQFVGNLPEQPEANAFVKCTFGEIDLGSMTQIAVYDDANAVCFYNCPDLGTVKFTNIEAIGRLCNSNSTKTKITVDSLGVVAINDQAFRYLDIQNDITILTGSMLGESAFRDALIDGTLTLQDNLTIPFNCFSSTRISQNLETGNSVAINGKYENSTNYGAFYLTKINGNAVFGVGNTFNQRSFAYAKIDGNVTFGENAYWAGDYCFRSATIKGDVTLQDGFRVAKSTAGPFYSTTIYGNITIGAGSFTTSAFNGATLGTPEKPIEVYLSSGTSLGSSCFVGTYYANFYLEDGITVSSSDSFRANIHGTVSIGQINFSSRSSNCEGLFGNARSNACNCRIENVVLRPTCTKIPKLMLASAVFGTITIQGTDVEIEERAFIHSRIDKIVGMSEVISIGDSAFGYEGADKDSTQHMATPPRTSVASGMDLSNVTSIAANAFERFTFNEDITANMLTSIGANAFKGASLKKFTIGHANLVTIGDSAFHSAQFIDAVTFTNTNVGTNAFHSAIVTGKVTFAQNTTIGAHAFAAAEIYGDLILGDGLREDFGDTDVPVKIAANAFNEQTVSSSTDENGVTTETVNWNGAKITGNVTFGYKTKIGSSAFAYVEIGDKNDVVDPENTKATVTIKDTNLDENGDGILEAGIAESAFANAKIYAKVEFGNVETIPASAFKGAQIVGNLDLGSVVNIGYEAFGNARLKSPLTIPAQITTIGERAFYKVNLGEANTSLIFEGSPTLAFESFFGSKITTITFEQAGVIEAEAFAEGTYGTINLGSVTSIGGKFHSFKDPVDPSVGAFRKANIGTINFEYSCVPSETNPQPIAERAFTYSVIGFLNFGGGAERALVNKQDDYHYSGSNQNGMRNSGAHSPFKNAEITRLNLDNVTSIGNSYFATLTIVSIDPINNDIELNYHTFQTTTIKSSLIFNGNVILKPNTFSFKSGLRTTIEGDLQFNNSVQLNRKGVANSNGVVVKGNLILSNISVDSPELDFLGKRGATSPITSTIEGNFIIKNTEELNCEFVDVTIRGGLVLDGVKKLCNYAFYRTTFAPNTVVNLPDATTIGNSAFSSTTNLCAINLPNVTEIGSYAFYNCESLTAMELPSLIRFTGRSQFSGCTNLKKISIGDQFESWGYVEEEVKDGDVVTGYNYYGTFSGSSVKSVILQKHLLDENGFVQMDGAIALPAGAKLIVPRGEKVTNPDGSYYYTNEKAYRDYFNNVGELWGGAEYGVTATNFDTIQFVLTGADGVEYLVELVGDEVTEIEIVGIVFSEAQAASLANGTFTLPSTLTRTLNGSTVTYTVASVSSSAMKDLKTVGSSITKIVLPSGLKYINFSGVDTPTNLVAYEIAAENTVYMTDANGILYTDDGRTLVMYPNAKGGIEGVITVAANVTCIGDYAFAGNSAAIKIVIEGNAVISDGAFSNCTSLISIEFTATSGISIFVGRDTMKNSLFTEDCKITYHAGQTIIVLYDTDLHQLLTPAS